MNNKGSSNTLVVVVLLAVIVAAGGYFGFAYKGADVQKTPVVLPDDAEKPDVEAPDDAESPEASVPTLPSLSSDRKSIVAGAEVLLAVEDDAIFDWFKTESQLCAGYNLTSVEGREEFCGDKVAFRSQTRFASIDISPDRMHIGFAIESDTLPPDTVVGIFQRSTDRIRLLSSYYLGNEFLGFSPSGSHFIYQANCWEGQCGLFVLDSETLASSASINNPEFLDRRAANAEFVSWLSDNQIQYTLGTELMVEEF